MKKTENKKLFESMVFDDYMKSTMKKILSIILAIISTFSFATIAFAHENVDNTFNNFTPGIGKTAPSNWYDPYCYDENGYILPEAMSYIHAARYCATARKIYTISAVAETADGYIYQPYRTTRKEYIHNPFTNEDVLTDCRYDFCPYCGLTVDGIEANDIEISQAIVYGCYCPDCGEFNGNQGYRNTVNSWCWNCNNNNLANVTVYRFIKDEYKNQEYSWLFDETAFMYGEGVDGRVEDLTESSIGGYYKWSTGPNGNQERALQILCKPPEWCRIKIPFWRF